MDVLQVFILGEPIPQNLSGAEPFLWTGLRTSANLLAALGVTL